MNDPLSGSSESPWETERKQRADLDTEKRMAIIRTACIAFVNNGYHETSMDEIATALGIFKPKIYTYFSSKAALLDACGEQAAQIWNDAAAQARDHEGSAAERLEIYLRRNIEFCGSSFGKAVLKLDMKSISPITDEKMRLVRRKIDRIFREIIQAGIDSGEIDTYFDPKLVSFALFGSFNFVAEWYKPGGPLSADDILGQYFKLFFYGLTPRT